MARAEQGAGAAALGLGLDRQLTRTGGLPFAGGPWNNYVMHAIATVVHDRGKGFALAAQMHSLVPHPGGTGTASVAAGPAGG